MSKTAGQILAEAARHAWSWFLWRVAGHEGCLGLCHDPWEHSKTLRRQEDV